MVILYVCGFAVLLIFTVSWVTYWMAFHVPRKKLNHNVLFHSQYDEVIQQSIDKLISMPYEDVHITSFDGLDLHGRYYSLQTDEKAPLVICFHGWRGSPIRDFCTGFFGLQELGYNILLIDERGCWESNGNAATFGVKERFDVLYWAEYAQKRFGEGTPVLLDGVSMGASSVLMASGLKLPPCVKGIVADAPYSSPKKILLKVAYQDMKMPRHVIWPFVWLGARVFASFNPLEVTAAEAVRTSGVPILLIHGQADGFVPCEMSEEIASSGSMVHREVFPDADHCMSYVVDTARYTKLLKDFTDQYITGT